MFASSLDLLRIILPSTLTALIALLIAFLMRQRHERNKAYFSFCFYFCILMETTVLSPERTCAERK
jgi:hypothetical protein